MTDQLALFGGSEHTVAPRWLDPDEIRFEPTSTKVIVTMQRRMSSASWRPGIGRKLSYLVWAGPDVIGLLQLASPVMILGVRDDYLGLPSDLAEKGAALRHCADMSVCVGAQPIAWHWNIGKLIAMTAPTFGDDWKAEYGDELRGLTTTSVYGRSSQYNRVWTFLGYTKGFGNAHVSDAEYQRIRRWLRDNNHPVPEGRRYAGRMGVLQWYRRVSGDTSVDVFHGRQRGVYYHDAIDPAQRSEVVRRWHERWGAPRWERTAHLEPPYASATEPTKPFRRADEH